MSHAPVMPEEVAPELPHPPAEIRRRWRLTFVFTVGLLLMMPFDWLMLERVSLAPALIRVAWSASVLVNCWLWIRLSSRWERLLAASNAVCTNTCFLLIVSLTGGPYSPYMHLVPCMPLLMALILPRTSWPALCSGVTCLVGTMAIMLAHGYVGHAIAWGGMVGAATFFGVYGSAQFRKAQAAEGEARLERDRREALEKLARAELQRAQAEKLATVGRLAAGVMHEVNNPLAFVRSNLEFLRAEVLAQPLPAAVREELGDVFSETRVGIERIQEIVSDLKGFSRMDGEEPSECVLADVVTDAARLAGVRLKNVATLKVEVPPELPGVFVTPRRLAQVVLNLLVNAGDALEEARVAQAEVKVTGRVEHGRVALLVEDNGPGFPPEVLPRLFEAFFTTKAPDKGTGLGLSLSRELVERFGGTLRAENRAEGGARVRMELPLHAPVSP